jgi:hypothetical protein
VADAEVEHEIGVEEGFEEVKPVPDAEFEEVNYVEHVGTVESSEETPDVSAAKDSYDDDEED